MNSMLERLTNLWNSSFPPYHGGNWFRRLRLWRAGGSSALWQSATLIVIFAAVDFVVGYFDGSFTVTLVSGVAILLWPVLHCARERQPMFAQEWLRPVSRDQAVDDYLRGIASDLATIPVLGIVVSLLPLVMGRAEPDFNLILKLLGILPATYVFCVGATVLLTLERAGQESLLGSCLLNASLAPVALLFFLPKNPYAAGMIAIPVSLGLAAYGALFIAIARRTWLGRELE